MSDDHIVNFKVLGKQPNEFTIERLAEYLIALAALAGSPGNVRVKKLTPGSVNVQLAVQQAHYPKFIERMTMAQHPARASVTLRKAITELEEMLTRDHAKAEMTAGRTKLLQLRGYTRESDVLIGPVIQQHVVRGQIIGLEGKDATKHVRISELGTGREVRGEFRDAALGERLTRLLWKDAADLSGTARLLRHGDGTWELRSFRVEGVTELEAGAPSAVVAQLRQALSDVDLGADPVKEAKKLRE